MQINVFDESSKYQKEIISILYRILLILYSATILAIKPHKINIWFTLGYFALFISLFLFLYNKDRIHTFLRLINDYIFIFITIYSIGKIDVYTFSLLIIPILNSQNHTGRRKKIISMFLYLFPMSIIFYIEKKIEYILIIPFLTFWLINSFEGLKNKYHRFYNELNSSLDNFLIQENSMDRLHKIYEIIIPIFNKHKFFGKNIKDIICFQKNNESFNLINSSSFIFEYKFDDLKVLILNNKRQLIYNQRVEINSELIEKNVMLKIKKNSIDYLFVIIPKNELSSLEMAYSPFFYKLLYPFFVRLSYIFNFKRVQNIDNRQNFYKMAKKVTYVNNAINSMHFTRNKLSPLKTYLSMIDDYEKETSSDRKEMIKPFLKEERKKLKTSLDLILNKANTILEKSNNPFNVIESNNIPFLSILTKVRDSSFYYLKMEKFDFIFSKFDFTSNQNVTVNETGMDLILSNWFSNVNKYKSEDYYGVKVSEDEDFYILTFFNKFNRINNKTPDFVEDFNSNDRMAILKRNTHGLIEIKEFLEQMGLDGKMYVEKDILNFEILFKKVKL